MTAKNAYVLAPKKLIAARLEDAMDRRNVTRSELVGRMNTTRAVVNRLLDPNDLRVSLAVICKASKALGVPLVSVA